MYSELLIHDGLGGIAINQLVQYPLYRAQYILEKSKYFNLEKKRNLLVYSIL